MELFKKAVDRADHRFETDWRFRLVDRWQLLWIARDHNDSIRCQRRKRKNRMGDIHL